MNKRRSTPRISGRLRRQLRPLVQELHNLHAEVVSVEQRTGGHLCLTIQLVGGRRTRKLFLSTSPSDHRAMKNLISVARNYVHELEQIEHDRDQ